MKKIFIFLMTILSVSIFNIIGANADVVSFYEGEYIDGIYMNKAKGGTTYYQKARFFRRGYDNQFSYCIEPFSMFNENSSYESSLTASNLSNEQMKRIKDIIRFGYGYGSHSGSEWYAITQFMVWQESDYDGDYYFTDYLNGNRISRFEGEINEINNLINDYYTIPSIANSEIDLVENQTITLSDTNNILSKYNITSSYAHINGNNLVIDGLKEGNYKLKLTRKEVINSNIPLFYNSSDSQNMVTVGDLDQIDIYITIRVKKTAIEIAKLDSDTNSTKPSGEATLIGSTYTLMDKNKNPIQELTIDNNNQAIINNLEYGRYFIQEKSPGKGYTLDKNIYEINISKTNPIIKLKLKNKVIEKDIELYKQYGEDNSFIAEEGISFDILDVNNKLIDTITTNSKGKADITLPYGTYTIKQRNTTDGYTSIKDFKIDVLNNKKETKKLYDYKIKVPNTYNESSSSIIFILLIIVELLYVKKSIFN